MLMKEKSQLRSSVQSTLSIRLNRKRTVNNHLPSYSGRLFLFSMEANRAKASALEKKNKKTYVLKGISHHGKCSFPDKALER